MKASRVPFDDLPWQTSPAGVRFKVHRDGAIQLRLLEFTPDLVHPNWCVAGHAGYVIEGDLEIEFDDHVERHGGGDGVLIPDKGISALVGRRGSKRQGQHGRRRGDNGEDSESQGVPRSSTRPKAAPETIAAR